MRREARRIAANIANAARSVQGQGSPTVTEPCKAQFEVLVDGTPRDFRVRKEFAHATAAIIKRKHLHAEVMLRDLETGEVTVIDQPSNPAAPGVERKAGEGWGKGR